MMFVDNCERMREDMNVQLNMMFMLVNVRKPMPVIKEEKK